MSISPVRLGPGRAERRGNSIAGPQKAMGTADEQNTIKETFSRMTHDRLATVCWLTRILRHKPPQQAVGFRCFLARLRKLFKGNTSDLFNILGIRLQPVQKRVPV